MNIHRLKRLIKEEVKRLKEQNTTPWGTAAGNVGTPGQPIQIRAGWKNKMVNVYTSFGCGGLRFYGTTSWFSSKSKSTLESNVTSKN